jgi:hypothetical protein
VHCVVDFETLIFCFATGEEAKQKMKSHEIDHQYFA